MLGSLRAALLASLTFALTAAPLGCSRTDHPAPAPGASQPAAAEPTPTTESRSLTGTGLRIVSQAFQQESKIPKKYTCEGKDVSPPLSIEGVPPAAKSLALVVEDPDAPDPDAPKRIWVHWVVYDLTPSTQALSEGIGKAPRGARDGNNDWKSVGYRGPCPPIGRHRYFVRLYALDAMLGDRGSPGKAGLESAMRGHVLESAELMGTYQKGD